MPPRFAMPLSCLKPKRRWVQFSVGTMMLAVTALCIWLADYVSAVRRLERQLCDPDEEVRAAAAERLGDLGPEARSAAKSLLRAVDDDSQAVGVKAVWALSRVSGRADLLAPLLTHDDDAIRLAAVEGMLWTGDDPTKLVPTLLELHPHSRVHAGAIFEALGPAQAAIVVPILLDSLSPVDEAKQRDPAVDALSNVALPAATVVPALIARLGNEQPKVGKAAAEQLLRLGELAKEAAPALRARLHDSDVACAAALCAVDPEDSEFLPVLKRSLHADDWWLNYQVTCYLWALGPDAAGAADDMVASVCDSNSMQAFVWQTQLQYHGVNPLGRIGPAAVSALDRALNQALADRDRSPATLEELQERLKNLAWVARPVLQRALERVRGAHAPARVAADSLPARLRLWMVRILEEAITTAATAAPNRGSMTISYLGMIGPPARSSVPALIAALDCADFRDSAVMALAGIGKDAAPAVPHLLPFLDSDNESLRTCALSALHRIGVSSDALRARLRPWLTSSDPHERSWAVGALAEFGEPAEQEEVRARWRVALTSGDLYERVRAAESLVALGEPAGQILPQIFDLALDPHFNRFGEGLPPGESYSPTMRAALTTSMASLGAAAVPDLTVNLQYPDPKVRRMAAEALGKIGPAARTSVPRLIELLDDEQAWDAAAEALGRIGPDAHAAVPKLLEALEAMRGRPDPSDYDPDENDPSEYDWTGYDMNEYVPRLHALGGIGAASRDAAPEVFRLANFDDMRIRHTAVLTLARIAPAHPSLVPLLRRWLCEWERKSTTADYGLSRSDRSIEEFADAVWELGPGAEEICRGHEIRGRE